MNRESTVAEHPAKTDLRVVKTKRLIRDAFCALLRTKPVNRITVTSLAQHAQINKGTFYLHYSDIYALYEQVLEETAHAIAGRFHSYSNFLRDPEQFVQEFLFSTPTPPTSEELSVLRKENLRFSARCHTVLVAALRQKLYQSNPLEKCRENDIRLDYIITGMLSLLTRPDLIRAPGSRDPFVISLLSGSIRQIFAAYF